MNKDFKYLPDKMRKAAIRRARVEFFIQGVILGMTSAVLGYAVFGALTL